MTCAVRRVTCDTPRVSDDDNGGGGGGGDGDDDVCLLVARNAVNAVEHAGIYSGTWHLIQ